MADLYIAEITDLGTDRAGRVVPVGKWPPAAEQKVAIGATSTASAAFGSNTHFIRVKTDGACHIAVSRQGAAEPEATTANAKLGAGDMEFLGVEPGGKIAVIQGS